MSYKKSHFTDDNFLKLITWDTGCFEFEWNFEIVSILKFWYEVVFLNCNWTIDIDCVIIIRSTVVTIIIFTWTSKRAVCLNYSFIFIIEENIKNLTNLTRTVFVDCFELSNTFQNTFIRIATKDTICENWTFGLSACLPCVIILITLENNFTSFCKNG